MVVLLDLIIPLDLCKETWDPVNYLVMLQSPESANENPEFCSKQFTWGHVWYTGT